MHVLVYHTCTHKSHLCDQTFDKLAKFVEKDYVQKVDSTIKGHTLNPFLNLVKIDRSIVQQVLNVNYVEKMKFNF